MQSKTRSLLRYPGSKARFAPFIAQALAMNPPFPRVFAEPFCGGASVSLALLEGNLVEGIVLNDADPLIAALWKCVFHPENSVWLANQLSSIPLTIDEWRRQKSLEPANQREAALKCLYLNRTSFNGILHQSGPIGGWGQKNRTLGVRFNRERLIARIVELSAYSDRVLIFNEPWKTFCIRLESDRDTFLFLDPPYYYKAEQLYGFVFDETEHKELRDYLSDLNVPWLLSYDDAKEVRALYRSRDIRARVIDNTYSTHPLGGASFIGREIIYSNLMHLPDPHEPNRKHVGLTVRESNLLMPDASEPARIPFSVFARQIIRIPEEPQL
jgi:DNA adenine methylase